MRKGIKSDLNKLLVIFVVLLVSFDILFQTTGSTAQWLTPLRTDFNCSDFNITNCSACGPGSYFDISKLCWCALVALSNQKKLLAN